MAFSWNIICFFLSSLLSSYDISLPISAIFRWSFVVNTVCPKKIKTLIRWRVFSFFVSSFHSHREEKRRKNIES